MLNKVTITRVANGYIITVEPKHRHEPVEAGGGLLQFFTEQAASPPQLFVAIDWQNAELIARQWLTGADVPAVFKED